MAGRCGRGCGFLFWFWVFFTAMAMIFLGIFIFWLIFLPKEIKFHVTDASLTQFDFTTANNTLHYNLVLNITLRNPNKRVEVYYREIEAIAYYGKNKFSTVALAPFYQGHKNTTTLRPVFEGQQLLYLNGRDVSKFDTEKSSGIFSIDIQLAFRIRARYGKIKSDRYEPPMVDCSLNVPLSSNGEPAGGVNFETTRCGNVYFFTDPNAGD